MCLLSGSVFFVYKLRRAEQMEKELPVKFKVAENRRKPFYSLLRRTTIFGTMRFVLVCLFTGHAQYGFRKEQSQN